MIRVGILSLALFAGYVDDSCGEQSSDSIQQRQQERMLAEGTAQTGMPAIRNFRERKLLKDILEMRDQDGLVTFTYLWNDMGGKLVFFCDSVGFPMPYSTEYTNPQKVDADTAHGYAILPQADPNGLFSPSSAEGTWVMCKDPNGEDARPVYLEPRIVVSPFKLAQADAPVESGKKP